ncbi:MAG: BlaI/MecI/CopY family transcriptional regulator [Lachnospirales bacterium]
MIKISDSEFEVMNVIWENEPINTKDIAKIVMEKSNWNVRTVHTLISRLEKKGAITHKKEGKIYVYTAKINKEEYIKNESKTFLGKFFNGSLNKLAMNLIENNMISDEDIKKLRDMLNKG